MKELSKSYDYQKAEGEINKLWETSGFYNPDVCIEKGVTGKDAPSFSMVLPPPNVTGTLHTGSAFMLVIQDILTRYHRMTGKKTLWIPGTDHAAIATQSKVEKILYKEEGKTRHDLGREKFLTKVEKFAQNNHDKIVEQIKKMGSSLDWSREAYTLDENRELAVRTAFKNMYDAGLIYRGDRIVNWDPKMQSTVSDDEIEYEEEKTSFYYFKYGPFTIGTARPETKFGDKYVVMHPNDERYKEYKHGQKIELEWINGPITATIIKDEAIDPEFGTGVMTITPWHSHVDYEIAEHHNLDKEQIIDKNAKLLPIAEEFAGENIRNARPKIVEKLKEKGLLVKIDENYTHRIARNYRGGGILEPQIMKQWFIDVNKKFRLADTAGQSNIEGIAADDEVSLKELMMHVVKSGQIKILPERFEKVYYHWIDNLHDWNISRQIWYGHRIPVWYKKNSKAEAKDIYVGIKPPQDIENWEQDPDTLDTWFSSGLWTFSTLGWPNKTEDLQTYHPTDVLETGYDILFFWVARMILMTGFNLGEIPFKNIYLHGLVRDDKGRKMSKSLDNIVDPLDIIEKYGTDALRMALIVGVAPGNDNNLGEDKTKAYKHFANKLWNIARFIQMNVPDLTITDLETKPNPKTAADKEILEKLEAIKQNTAKDINRLWLHEASNNLYQFVWHEFADIYIEASKEQMANEEDGNTKQILVYCLNTILRLLHPFMPFVTEELFQQLKPEGDDRLLMVQNWPL